MNIEHDDFGDDINPATGLPMIRDMGIDVSGNPYGTDRNSWFPVYDAGPCFEPDFPSFDDW